MSFFYDIPDLPDHPDGVTKYFLDMGTWPLITSLKCDQN